MTIERIRELSDSTILSLFHCTMGKENDDIVKVLEERGYHFCGFSWTKDENAKDPVEEMRKKIYGEK